MRVTYFGHSSIQLEVQGRSLLVDPFISYNENASITREARQIFADAGIELTLLEIGESIEL